MTGYRWIDTDAIFRRKSVYISYNRTSDYEDNIERSGFYLTSFLEFLNYWGLNFDASNGFKSVSKTLTRGGAKLNIPSNISFNISAYTDSRERIIVSPYIGYYRNDIGGNEFNVGVNFEWKPNSQISFSFGPDYYANFTSYQWVRNFSDQYATKTYNTRYVFADLNQKTLSANIRLNWIFTPAISLQLYIQPLFAVGDYENFKELINPPTLDAKQYGTEGTQISYDEESMRYTVDPDEGGPAEAFSFDNPDFNFKSLRGNLVLRWEALPGSVFYFAWTNSRMNFENPGEFNFKNDFRNLINSEADDIFLIKFSYWIDI